MAVGVVSVGENVEFASNPNRWPAWPQLPLVRGKELGRLFHVGDEGDEVRPIVYLGNIFAPVNTDTRTATYPTLRALFEDGWQID